MIAFLELSYVGPPSGEPIRIGQICVHHLAFWIDDLPQVAEQLKQAGVFFRTELVEANHHGPATDRGGGTVRTCVVAEPGRISRPARRARIKQPDRRTNMSHSGLPADVLGLGPVDQIAFAARDLDRVLPMYEVMFGPFEVRELTTPRSTYQDTTVQPTIKITDGRSGDLNVEIIEVLSGQSTVLDHLDRHDDGLHHIRFLLTRRTATGGHTPAAGIRDTHGRCQ